MFVYCMYDCMVDVGSLGGSKFLRMWLTLKCGIFNSPLIFELEYPNTSIRMSHAKGVGQFAWNISGMGHWNERTGKISCKSKLLHIVRIITCRQFKAPIQCFRIYKPSDPIVLLS